MINKIKHAISLLWILFRQSSIFSQISAIAAVILVMIAGFYVFQYVLFPKPVVISVFPTQNSEEVGLETPIYFNFNIALSPRVLENITISPDHALQGSLGDNNKTLILSPQAPLAPESEHVVTINSPKSARGRRGDSIRLVFTTYSLPIVQSTSPAAGAVAVSPADELIIVFSKPVSLESFDYQITPDIATVPVLGSGEMVLSLFLQESDTLMQEEQLYTITLDPKKDKKDNLTSRSLKDPYTFSFKTRGATQEERTRVDNIANSQDTLEALDQSITADPYLNLINNLLPHEEDLFKVEYFPYTNKIVVTLLSPPPEEARSKAAVFIQGVGLSSADERITWLTYLVEE